jgi:zeaxanthin glucosyltransferase
MGQRRVILFLLYHGRGHFNACFHLARTVSQSHDVVFAGVEFFKHHVTAQGFTYHPLKTIPFGIGLEKWYNIVTKQTPIYWQTLRDRWKDRLYLLREKELTNLIDTLQPERVLLDAQQSTDFVVLYNLVQQRSIRLALLHTMLPTALRNELPPMNSKIMIGDADGISEAQRDVENEKKRSARKQWLQYFGMTDHKILLRRIEKNKIPSSYLAEEQSLFPLTLTNLPEFVMSPKELDFTGIEYPSSFHFLGSQVDHLRAEPVDPEYNKYEVAIRHRVVTAHAKLIYCSLGTVPPEEKAVILLFINKLISVTSAGFILILSHPLSEAERIQLANGHDHVYFFNHVPQLQVLAHAHLFINHGGLNSIKESIATSVPMLIYPIDSNYDQNGNSSRVIYHGLGLRGDIRTDSENMIQEKINEVINSSSYLAQLRKFQKLDAQYSLKPFLDFVND